jgi:hypothetical protein
MAKKKNDLFPNIKKKPHDCVVQIQEQLKEYNTQLETNLFDPTQVFVQTVKVDTKKRGKAKMVLASYCPFCGVKLTKE